LPDSFLTLDEGLRFDGLAIAPKEITKLFRALERLKRWRKA
jgi:hypothetical protein